MRLNTAQLAPKQAQAQADPAAVAAAAALGPLRPSGRDSVGVVVRDLGLGVSCGLLVRALGGAAAGW